MCVLHPSDNPCGQRKGGTMKSPILTPIYATADRSSWRRSREAWLSPSHVTETVTPTLYSRRFRRNWWWREFADCVRFRFVGADTVSAELGRRPFGVTGIPAPRPESSGLGRR